MFSPRNGKPHGEWLTANVFRFHEIPILVSEKGLARYVRDHLQFYWRKNEVQFPDNAEIVLVHDIDFPQRRFVTSHAGLLLPLKTGFMFLEKAGGSGPFVRLDIKRKKDLLVWLGNTFAGPPEKRFGYTHHFVTINSSEMHELKE